MMTPHLLDRVRREARVLAGGYFADNDGQGVELVGPPALGNKVGLYGALALAMDACGADPADLVRIGRAHP